MIMLIFNYKISYSENCKNGEFPPIKLAIMKIGAFLTVNASISCNEQ